MPSLRHCCPVAWLVACLVLSSAGCSSQSVPVTSKALTSRCEALGCPAPDSCHLPGTCDATTGACTFQARTCPPGQACDLADGSCRDLCANAACLASDRCHVAGTCDPANGRCSAETARVCPAGESCDPTTGTCGNPCAGVVCNAPDLCHVPGTCDPRTGTCSAGVVTTCPLGQACQATTGQCVDPCAGVVCTASDLCHVAGGCSAGTGTCSPEVPRTCPSATTCDLADGQCKDLCAIASCPQGQSCDPASGSCRIVATVPVAVAARSLLVTPPAGVAMDVSGNTYVASSIFSVTPVLFDGHPVASAGDSDLLAARYDTSGRATWAVGFGDASAQAGRAVAVTRDGTVAIIGTYSGTMAVGPARLVHASPVDFLVGIRSSDGSGLFAVSLDNGLNGQLKSVAASPQDASARGNRVAVCGLANGVMPSDLAGPSARPAAANDIVIGAFRTDGTRLWGAQFASTGVGSPNEECDAIAVDDNGDVLAAGTFTGQTLSFGGSTAPLTGPNLSFRKALWVAKFDGATGTPMAAAVFLGSNNVVPAAIAADGAGNVILGGSFTGSVAFGATTLTGAGGTDAWIAKLGPGLAPAWAVRLGGPAADAVKGLAVDGAGGVIVTGFFTQTTTGAAVLTASGTSAADVFLLKLDGATGATHFAAAYGDGATQTGDGIAVNRAGGNEFAVTGTLNGSVTFPAPAGTVTASSGDPELFLLVGQVK